MTIEEVEKVKKLKTLKMGLSETTDHIERENLLQQIDEIEKTRILIQEVMILLSLFPFLIFIISNLFNNFYNFPNPNKSEKNK